MSRIKFKISLITLFLLVLAPFAWSVDFNCPAGAWYLISSEEPCACFGTSGSATCEQISGGTKTLYCVKGYGYCSPPGTVCGNLPGCALFFSGPPCLSGNPCSGSTVHCPQTWGIATYEWRCPCTGSETKSCYDGPAGTEGVGICRAGTQTCSNGWFGSCQGQVTPQTEICGDGIDNNCDGQIDEGCGIQLPETVYQCADEFKTTPPYYDTTTQSICSKGCLLSSLAMVLDYYLNKKGLPVVDVESLNEWLKNNNGFKPDGRINWSAIEQYPGTDVFYDWKGSKTASKETLDKELADGHPMILNVKDGNHFVIAIGKESDTYKIIDPGYTPQTTTLKERYNNNFDGIRIIRPR